MIFKVSSAHSLPISDTKNPLAVTSACSMASSKSNSHFCMAEPILNPNLFVVG